MKRSFDPKLLEASKRQIKEDVPMGLRKIICLLAICSSLLFVGPGNPAQAAEIKIGVVMGLSGPPVIADFGNTAMQGIKLAFKEYNAAGGYKGNPVTLITYDDEANPRRAVEMATRLITHDKVVAMMGTVSSGNVLAFMHLNQKNHIPLMAGPAIASPITDRYKNEPKNFIFRGSMREEYQVNAILNYVTRKFKKIGLIHSTTGYGMAAKKELVEGLKKRGREFVALESYSLGSGDITPQVIKMKNAGAEVILNYAEDYELISKVSYKLDYHPKIIGNWGISGYKTFNLIGRDLIQGVMMGQALDLSDPKAAAIDAKFRKEYGKAYDWPVVVFLHYDGARLLLKALDMAGPNPEGIRDALERINDFDAATTAVPKKPFSKEDHEILDPDGVFLGVWKGDIVVRVRD
jgi:branched-chain amino acid transport system substrate-binding protein